MRPTAHRPAFFMILSHRYTFGSKLWRDVTVTVFCCKFVVSKLRPQIRAKSVTQNSWPQIYVQNWPFAGSAAPLSLKAPRPPLVTPQESRTRLAVLPPRRCRPPLLAAARARHQQVGRRRRDATSRAGRSLATGHVCQQRNRIPSSRLRSSCPHGALTAAATEPTVRRTCRSTM